MRTLPSESVRVANVGRAGFPARSIIYRIQAENTMYTKKRVCLDLCSGLGGWSEAFVQQGWTVIRIENNPELAHIAFTRQLDVLEWADWIDDIPHPDVILCSPPCLEFSEAYAAPRMVAKRTGQPFEPDMSIVQACLDIIDFFKPTYWVLENVRGAQEFFLPLIGGRRQKISSFYLWGNFPLVPMPQDFEHRKMDHDTWSENPLRANIRAMIPFEVSFQMESTIREQWNLQRWY